MQDLEKIKERIKKLGLKKSFVANKIGIHPVTFSYFLNGKKKINELKEKDLLAYLGL